MPNRIIRETGLTSRKLARVSDFAERLYWRLIQAADDYGRFHGEPRLILARCFPLMLDRVTLKKVQAGRNELAEAGLLEIYAAGDDEILQITKWEQRVRATSSKFPPSHGSHLTVIRQSAAPVVEDRGSRNEDRGAVRPPNAGPSCAECHAALEELNRRTGRHYTGSGEGLRSLHARHQEHGMPAVLRVIRVKSGAWLHHPKMSKFLRPETLFRLTKFDSYVNEPERPTAAGEQLSSVRQVLAEVKA